MEDFIKEHPKAQVNYVKGLGELLPQELGEAIMFPESRKLEQIVVEDVEEFDTLIKNLMGKDSTPKKNFIFGQGGNGLD